MELSAVFRAAWRNTVHLALAVCLSISVFVLLWIAGMMFRMIGINTVLDVLGHARFHIAAWPIVLAVSLVGVRRPQIADTLRRSWLTLNAGCCRWWRWWAGVHHRAGGAHGARLRGRQAVGRRAHRLLRAVDQADQRSLAGQPRAAPFGQGLSRTLRLAMLCLLPLAAVALYGLGLRVGQYGWTIPRVWALYCGGLLALYALGYAWPRCGPRAYGTLATTNLVAAFATLVLLALVQTPVADPHRRAKPAAGPAGRPPGTARIPLQQHAQRPRPLGRDALRQLADGAASSAIRASRRRRRAR